MTTASCDVCGNEYERTFEVTMAGITYTFDSFRVRDSKACADMQSLSVPNPRPRRRCRRSYVLLRTLRTGGTGR
jgi:hypothetical protein